MSAIPSTFADFIDDGYTESATIDAVDGVNGELAITYRPAMPEQVGKLLDSAGSDEKYLTTAIDLLGQPTNGLLTGWTLKKASGEVVKIDRASIARVRRPLLLKIIERVFFQSEAAKSLKN